MLDWNRLDTVLLDLDGTLLDLHFDSTFWRRHLPRHYCRQHGRPPEAARALLARMDALRGTLPWYCLEHWSRRLGLDVAALQHRYAHAIRPHPGVREWLAALAAAGRRPWLVSNAHPKTLALKLARSRLGDVFEPIVSAHALGAPKEDRRFWLRLQALRPFDPARTLLVDDNPAALTAARDFGVAAVVLVRRPDSQAPPQPARGFPAVMRITELAPP